MRKRPLMYMRTKKVHMSLCTCVHAHSDYGLCCPHTELLDAVENENTPIQIYRKFILQKLKIFR